jgi:hypothetical protein
VIIRNYFGRFCHIYRTGTRVDAKKSVVICGVTSGSADYVKT